MGATMTIADSGSGQWGLDTPAARPVTSDVKDELYLEEEIRSEAGFEGIVGQSAALREVLEQVETVATCDATVLLLGETGTGKELIARALHLRSCRKARPLVKLNCAAIPSGLLESELFGHERGAFTGAISQKIGQLELADQGTLFLDEVGDIPLELQPKLLRVLQEREFERLGSTRTIKVDVRLVAATHRDLETMMAENQFRRDLYYRLNVISIRIPPLRERPEDIPALVRYFTDKFARRIGKRIDSIPAGALRKLMGWHWPGNIRELENTVERAVILTAGNTLEISVPSGRSSGASVASAQESKLDEQKKMVRILTSLVERVAMLPPEDSQTVSMAELTNNGASAAPATGGNVHEQQTIVRVLGETKGRVGGANGAAARLGLKRTTLIARMKKLGIDGHFTATERRWLEQDLERAEQVQRELLPDEHMRIEGWEVSYCYRALGPVGGDYCDIMRRGAGERELLVTLGDASGKGIAASLLMAQLHAIFRNLGSANLRVQELVEQANRILCQHGAGVSYATVVCIQATSEGDVEICNAGHCPPLLIGQDCIAQIESGGLPLGLFPDARWTVTRRRMSKGDSLLLYTDGLTEARDSSDSQYGAERLLRTVQEGWALPPPALIEACMQSVAAFQAGVPSSDDVAAMAMRYV
jgi:DNA-binding NtrC family response regulator